MKKYFLQVIISIFIGGACLTMFSSCDQVTTPVSSTFWQMIGQFPAVNAGGVGVIPAGQVGALAVSNRGAIFAGTSTGLVFSSTNSGSSWYPTILSNDNTGNSGVEAIAVTSFGVAFAGIASSTSPLNAGLFVSSDAGESWYQTSLGSFSVEAIAVDNTAGIIYVGTGFGSGMFGSSNGGVSWYPMNIGLTDQGGIRPNVWSLAVDQYGVVYAGTGSGEVFRSTNYGATWVPTPIAASSGITTLAVNNQYLYAGAEGDSIYRSSDGGTTWQLVTNGINVAPGSSHALWNLVTGTQGEIFAGFAAGGVYVSSDNGISWNGVNGGLTDGLASLASSASGFIFVGGLDGYVYASIQSQ